MPILYIALFVWPFAAPGGWTLLIGQLILTLIVAIGNEDYDGLPFFSWLVGGMVPYIITLMILVGFYPEIAKPVIGKKTVLEQTTTLVSLSSEVGIQGQFALGYGTVDSTPIYMSKRRTADGGYENLIIRGVTTLYEDAPDSARATLQVFRVYEREMRKKTPTWVLYITKKDATDEWQVRASFNRIHVPAGTIMRDFKA